MASEDSVEHYALGDAPVLAVPIDGVGKSDEPDETFGGTVPALIEQHHDRGKYLVVFYAPGEAHVVAEEGNDLVPEDASIANLQHQHVWVPRFGKDRV